ncbi:MAG: ABC transporter substrate-binding protein [Fusobacteriaceae bacterium]
MKIKTFILVVIVSILTSCGKDSNKEKRRTILAYTAMENEYISEYTEAFSKKYPNIKIEVISSATGEMLAKLIAEKKNPQADVIWSLSDIMILEKDDILKAYIPSEGFSEIPLKYKDSSGYWVGTSVWMLGLGINTEELKKINMKLPESYYDLLNERYKNNLLMVNPGSSGTGYMAVKTFINIFGEEKAWEYMDVLHKNIATYTSSGNAPTQIVSRGERVGGFIPAYQGIIIEKKGELPFKTIFPKEGIGWELEANALINKVVIKPESKIFLDWLLSEEAMKILAKTRGFVTNPKYALIDDYPQQLEERLKVRDFKYEIKNRDRILKEWEKRYGKEN